MIGNGATGFHLITLIPTLITLEGHDDGLLEKRNITLMHVHVARAVTRRTNTRKR